VTRPALVAGSLARLGADVGAFVLGGMAALITARWLGPAGKGLFATLVFLTDIGSRMSTLGLGEGAISFVGRRLADAQRAISATLAGVGFASIAGAMGVFAVSVLVFSPESGSTWAAVAIGAAGVPVAVAVGALTHILNVQQRVVAASGIFLLTSALTLTGVAVFVMVLDLGVAGAVAGSVLGTGGGVLVAAVVVKRRETRLTPVWDNDYLRLVLPYGLRLELSQILVYGAARLDVLLVYSLAGADDAGFYSVALTIATVVGFAPFAISYATFPHLPRLDERAAASLTAMSVRYGVSAALLAALIAAVITPPATPLLFGTQFEPAVVPALILIAGAVASGGQWLLARAAAAAGDARLLLRSYGLSLVVMVLLDLGLIPAFQARGAAIASVVASVAGLVFCLVSYRGAGAVLASFIPRPADLRRVLSAPLRLGRESSGRRNV
jgi:stage V sporulation protein B